MVHLVLGRRHSPFRAPVDRGREILGLEARAELHHWELRVAAGEDLALEALELHAAHIGELVDALDPGQALRIVRVDGRLEMAAPVSE